MFFTCDVLTTCCRGNERAIEGHASRLGVQVHEGCVARVSEAACSMGRHRRLILPPIAVLKDLPRRKRKGEGNRRFASQGASLRLRRRTIKHADDRNRTAMRLFYKMVFRLEVQTTVAVVLDDRVTESLVSFQSESLVSFCPVLISKRKRRATALVMVRL